MIRRRPFAVVLFLVALAALLPLVGCSNAAADKAAIDASLQSFSKAVNAKDINGIMAYYAPDNSLLVYDVIPPRQYVGADAYRKDWQGVLDSFPGALHFTVADWSVETAGDLAYAHGVCRLSGMGKDGKPLDETLRVTDVYRKLGGKWLVVHEHVSAPIDPVTLKPDMDSKL
jgi:ketosteroid isomerase-like protein